MGSLEVPAVRAGEAVFGERQLEVALPFFQAPRIVELLDTLAAVDVDEAQLEGAGLHLTRFVTDVVVPALEPPEHEFLIGTSCATLQASRFAVTMRHKLVPEEGIEP